MSNPPEHLSSIAPALVQGLALGLALIVAIGAQNAFVLRQGLRREHVASVVLFCALADAVLITAGVLGMAQALGEHREIAGALACAGAVFLLHYAWQALCRARRTNSWRKLDAAAPVPLAGVIAQAAAFTLLNPHVYLDTVLLVGSIGAQQPQAVRAWFVLGASLASVEARFGNFASSNAAKDFHIYGPVPMSVEGKDGVTGFRFATGAPFESGGEIPEFQLRLDPRTCFVTGFELNSGA